MITIKNEDLAAIVIAAKIWYKKQSKLSNGLFDEYVQQCEDIKKELMKMKNTELMIDEMPF